MMKKWLLMVVFIFSTSLFAQTANEILQKVDNNYYSENRIIESEMHIMGKRGSRTIESKSWISGAEKAFTEYLAPAREKGVKMLKLKDELWMYTPSSDRLIKISGHLLRQSVMGSDLSYEDLMEDVRLTEQYSPEILGEEIFLERKCWILKLQSNKKDVAYYSRKIWVDKERYIALKEERFGKSGNLLKTLEVKQVEKVENRWIATDAVFKDVLKNGDGTEFKINKISLNTDIPDYIFSKASLKK